jgi:hypothetical protein
MHSIVASFQRLPRPSEILESKRMFKSICGVLSRFAMPNLTTFFSKNVVYAADFAYGFIGNQSIFVHDHTASLPWD